MGAGHPKDQAMVRSVELSVQPAFSREGLEIELMIGHDKYYHEGANNIHNDLIYYKCPFIVNVFLIYLNS